jgi:small-conductance mechanosensitive channel
MNSVTNYSELTIASLRAMGEKTMGVLPNIIGAFILILIGWLVAKGISWAVKRVLTSIGLNRWTAKLNNSEFFSENEVKFDAVKVISQFAYWIVILLFVITASETLGWSAVSHEIGGLIRYIPKLISAIIILVIGLYIASVIRKAIHATFSSVGISGAKGISTMAFYIIAIFLSITALNQAGIDTSVITNNITIILGSVLFAFAIAFGLGSKELLQNMLSGMYSRRTFHVGQKIKMDDIIGIIDTMDSLNITIQTQSGRVVIPAQQFLNSRVEILDEGL